MNFYDLSFIFLFIPFLIFLSLFSQKIRNLSLLFFSIFFYLINAPEYILILLISVSINFIYSLYVRYNKLVLVLAITSNLLILIYYKYLSFFFNIFGFEINYSDNIYLPLGISFFTFQQINYVIDKYNNKILENNFSKYSFFIIFFPQLIAGPLLRYNNFFRLNIENDKYKRINIFLIILSIALFKKIFLANNLALINDDAFLTVNDLSFVDAWLVALSFHFEIYFDFSAYCDFAVAAGYLFGFNIPINFNSPYKKNNIIGFWRSWNITVSNFFRKNIFNFLTQINKETKISHYVAILITMLISGLWHGASYNFLLWGGLHGSAIVINHIYSRQTSFLNPYISFLLLQLFLIFSWIVFRCKNIEQTLLFWKKMIYFDLSSFNLLNFNNLALILFSIMIIYFTPNSYIIFRKLRLTSKIKTFYLFLSSIVIYLVCISDYEVKKFIYFDF